VKIDESLDELAQLLRKTLVVHSDVRTLLQRVKDNGKELAVISNHASVWFDYLFDTYNLASLFPHRQLVIVSQTVQAAKPQSQIFELLLNRLRTHFDAKIEASAVLFIDDKMENVRAAQSVGFQSFEFNHDTTPVAELEASLRKFGALD
jgi:HAD superfamily hydrolase (TIGR01509 family)